MNGSFRFAGDLFPELSRLQQRLDEVFQTGGATNIRELARGTFPAVNVGSSPDSIEVLAFAPGVDSKTLQITVDKGLLVIAGERSRANSASSVLTCLAYPSRAAVSVSSRPTNAGSFVPV